MVTAVILAAGEGTRMKSAIPKVLHKLGGKTMLEHILEALKPVTTQNVVVVGHKAREVREVIGEGTAYAYQLEQLGTGHAVAQALDFIPEEGEVLIVCGDTPLLTTEIFRELLDFHRKEKCAATVLTAVLEEPFGYGRIIRDEKGKVIKIVEEKDASLQEKKVHEINTGTYCVQAYRLKKVIQNISPENHKGEYYLTDLVELLARQGQKVSGMKIKDFVLAQGINNRIQLAKAAEIMRRRINEKLMLQGVTMIDPSSVYVDIDVEIGKDTVILPQTIIEGSSNIGEGCIIGPHSRLVNVFLGDEVIVQNSVLLDSSVGDKANIGPFAYIRPETKIGPGVKVGDFVEIKKSEIAEGSKIPHLSYVGDSTIGKKVNLGAGTIIVNYDSVNKHRTVIEDEAFIGCNSNLIAPVHIGKGAYVGAGSTINDDVPRDALALARSFQVNKLNAARRLRSVLKIKKEK